MMRFRRFTSRRLFGRSDASSPQDDAEKADSADQAESTDDADDAAADKADQADGSDSAGKADEADSADKADKADTADAPAAPTSDTSETPVATKPPQGRVPGLDGVRGIAVIAVVLYHFWPSVFPGGFLGVDMFFVLSGFLITGLLIREHTTTGRISLKEFWRRRARRILPAALVVILVVMAVVSLSPNPDLRVGIGLHGLSAALFFSNWHQVIESGSYFAAGPSNVFMHYWSLSIEEQFYVLWPLLALGALWLGRTYLVAIAGLLTASSLIIMIAIYDPLVDPTRVYFGTDSHLFGLTMGALLAALVYLFPSFPRSQRFPITLPLLLGLFAMIALLPDTSPLTYRGGLFLASLLTAGLVWASVAGGGLVVPWVLESKALKWFGDRSFSLYLWHWPVLLLVAAWVPGGWASVVALAVTLGLSAASYRWVETPLRRDGYRATLRRMRQIQQFGSVALGAIGALLVVGILVTLITAPRATLVQQQLEALAAESEKTDKAEKPTKPAKDPKDTKAGTEKEDDSSPDESDSNSANADAKNSSDSDDSTTSPTPVPIPRGNQILAVGDSVLLAAKRAMETRFPGIILDGEVSRHYIGGESILTSALAANPERSSVILSFGTNGKSLNGELERMIDEIGPDRTVYVVAPYGPQQAIKQAAQQVIEVAAEHSNVYPVMWCQAAVSQPDAMYSDRVHPVPGTGDRLYVGAVLDAMKLAAAGKEEPSGLTCPPMV